MPKEISSRKARRRETGGKTSLPASCLTNAKPLSTPRMMNIVVRNKKPESENLKQGSNAPEVLASGKGDSGYI